MTAYSWCVIGAGPAGIAAVGRLLDHGIADAEIAWIDPQFGAGDFGGKWRAVSSNTRVELFLDFLTGSPSFRYPEAPPFALNDIDPQQTCRLGLVAEPLVWISQHLVTRVSTHRTIATELMLRDRQWTVTTEDCEITAKSVILATGAVPKKLSDIDLDEIAIEAALDPIKLEALPIDGATVAVFGSSHSAMVAIPNLLNSPVSKVINFYRDPMKYAVRLADWILYDDTGLKGQAAEWAHEHVDGAWPERLERCFVGDSNFEKMLEMCDHVVYTMGFERRRLPLTPQWAAGDYDPASGIIAPGLFGVGIAYPEYRINPLGSGEYRVGLHKFMQRLDAVLPLWLRYQT